MGLRRMPQGRHKRTGWVTALSICTAAAVLLVTSGGADANAPESGQGSTPATAVNVVPSDGLTDGQTVQVQGGGFLPVSPVSFIECGPVPITLGAPQCDFTLRGATTSDASGNFGPVGVTVVRTISNAGGAVDCASQSCDLFAVVNPGLSVCAGHHLGFGTGGIGGTGITLPLIGGVTLPSLPLLNLNGLLGGVGGLTGGLTSTTLGGFATSTSTSLLGGFGTSTTTLPLSTGLPCSAAFLGTVPTTSRTIPPSSVTTFPNSFPPPFPPPFGSTFGLPIAQVFPSSVVAGQPATVTGSGFAPFRTVEATLFSTPSLLGRASTDSRGSFSLPVVIPSDTLPGPHEVVVTGLDAFERANAPLTVIDSVPFPSGFFPTPSLQTFPVAPPPVALAAAPAVAAPEAVPTAARRVNGTAFTGARTLPWAGRGAALVIAGLLMLAARSVFGTERRRRRAPA